MSRSIKTVYIGKRDNGAQVSAHYRNSRVKPLNYRLDLANHSPTGFEWGYGGSGPAQLSLAILADYLQDDQRAMMLYQSFKWEVIARLPRDKGWMLDGQDIEAALAKIRESVTA